MKYKVYPEVAARFERNADAANKSVSTRQRVAQSVRQTVFDEVSRAYKVAPREVRRGLALMLARLER